MLTSKASIFFFFQLLVHSFFFFLSFLFLQRSFVTPLSWFSDLTLDLLLSINLFLSSLLSFIDLHFEFVYPPSLFSSFLFFLFLLRSFITSLSWLSDLTLGLLLPLSINLSSSLSSFTHLHFEFVYPPFIN